MSFFFKKDKDKKGTPSTSSQSGTPEKPKSAAPTTIPPANPANAPSAAPSVTSVPSADQARPRQSEEPQAYGTRPSTSSGQPTIAPASASSNASLYPWSQKPLNLVGNQPSPFPRYGAAVNSNASKEGDIYIMGGLVNGQTVMGDLWIVESGSSLACYPVKTEVDGPGPRVGHASLLVGNAFIVFGGDTKQDEHDPLDDTLYLLNTSTKQWSRALPPGSRPAGRYGHTMNIVGSKLYVFGGQVDGHFFNDLLAFDLNQLQSPTNHWEMLVEDSQDSFNKQNPLGRTNHTMITWQEKLYLFGGTDGIQWFNDVWTFDPRLNAWTQLDCIGYIPQPREGHSAALVNDVMYIFGGRTQDGDDLGDLAAFRITSRRWYTFQNMGPSPSPRSGHSMTAFDKQIVVLAGEPSSIQRDPAELGLVYILDTAKIRYPNDQQIQQTPAGERVAGNRRPSTDKQNGRSIFGRDAPAATSASLAPPQASGKTRQPGPPVAPLMSGPPPQQQAPAPRPAPSFALAPAANTGPGPRNSTPTDVKRPFAGQEHSRGPSIDERAEFSDASRTAGVRSISAGSNNRPTQPQQVQYGNTQSEDSRSVVPNGPTKFSTQASIPHKGQYDSPRDNSDDTIAAQNGTFLARDTMVFDDNNAPNLATEKELDELRKANASYQAELGAARKAGYVSGADQHASFDGASASMGEQHQRVPEQLTRIRNAFTSISTNVPAKFESLVQHIAELERQRDAAVRDAANANARLAASMDSPSSSPHLESRELDSSEHHGSLPRKLALTIAAHKELQSKFSALESQHAIEKKAREVAESNADIAHQRVLDLDGSRNPAELESLRTELYESQKEARENAARLNEIQSRSELLEIEHDDLKQQLAEHTNSTSDHVAVIGTLRSAVSASDEKYTLLERQLQAEREAKESVQVKLSQLRTEHENSTSELVTTSKKLKDAEELAEKNANEAAKHREVILAGLDKLSVKPADANLIATHEKKVASLQQQAKDANALVAKSQADTERATDKLRSAEERIAGLEAYQQQTSRDALSLRKQLQEAIRTAQQFQSQHAEAAAKLEANQRDANALGVQHGALKNIMEQRSASATRSIESPGPDSVRLRELEQMLEESHRAHEETKSNFEISQHDSEKAYRDKLEQLEQDYQSAVSYVKGTEKMLKRMKDELTKSKAQNTRLMTDLETARAGGSAIAAAAPAGWELERQTMQQEIGKMQDTVKTAITQMETQVAEVQKELQAAQKERDQFRVRNDQLNMAVEQNRQELEVHKRDNAALEARAADAEGKVTLLLDQMEHSVDHYRRQSQMQHQQQSNGAANHTRDNSISTYGGGHSHTNSIGGESFSTSGMDRNSMALDNLASELETLRTQWEGTHKTYRLSNNYDFDRRPSDINNGGELSSSLASWRKRLDAEERDKSRTSDATPAALRTGPSRQES